jgi:hypothetical protein
VQDEKELRCTFLRAKYVACMQHSELTSLDVVVCKGVQTRSVYLL